MLDKIERSFWSCTEVPIRNISLDTRFNLPLSCPSSLLGHRDESRRWQTGFEGEADLWGLRRAQERKGGGEVAELNLQVRLFGHLPASLRCPLLYLSTWSFCLLSSPPLLFLSFPWSGPGRSLDGDGFPACLATHHLPSFHLLYLSIYLSFLTLSCLSFHAVFQHLSTLQICPLSKWKHSQSTQNVERCPSFFLWSHFSLQLIWPSPSYTHLWYLHLWGQCALFLHLFAPLVTAIKRKANP